MNLPFEAEIRRVTEFSVSHELVKVGFATVEKIVEFREEQALGHAPIQAGWLKYLKYFDEIIEQLKLLLSHIGYEA